MKKSYLVVSMGGPRSEKDIPIFLKNMFLDYHILPFNILIRKILAFFISKLRPKKVIPHYKKIGFPSPIITQTEAQAMLLKKYLKEDVKVAFSYIPPYVKDVIKILSKYVVLVPMYPHYSFSTFQAVIDDAKKNRQKDQELFVIKPFYDKDFFVNFYKREILKALKKIDGKTLILFSAHSIPLHLVEKFKDPYPEQIKVSVELIMKDINVDYEIGYQSKMGKVPWLEPSVEKVMEKYKNRYDNLILVPISFLCEHLETLYELDIEYKNLAKEMGYKNIIRIPTPQTDKLFIEGFANYISEEKNYEKV